MEQLTLWQTVNAGVLIMSAITIIGLALWALVLMNNKIMEMIK